jgi:hypothetical protein
MVRRRSVGQQIYSGTAEFGRITAVIGAAFATVIGIALIVWSVFLLTHKTTYTGSVTGRVISGNCVTDPDDGGNTTCTVTAGYQVGGKSYTTAGMVDSPNVYREGDTITVHYDPSNPRNAALQSDESNIVGWIFLSIGIVVISISWLSVWLTHRYKAYAAVSGVATAADMVFGR